MINQLHIPVFPAKFTPMLFPFLKMNGAGNDFVILDGREERIRLTSEQVKKIAARDNPDTGGCDQVIVMEPSKDADVFMRIYNSDGGEVDACGNATRCVAWRILEERKTSIGSVNVQTKIDILHCESMSFGPSHYPGRVDGTIEVKMTVPKFGQQDIPLSLPLDKAKIEIEAICELKDPAFVSMGNPHVVFFVKEPQQIHLIEKIGAQLEKHVVFPEGVNVSTAYIGTNILTRVWERGVGLTASCGTAACAVIVAGIQRDLLKTGTYHTLNLQNGSDLQLLDVSWNGSGCVSLCGPVQKEFEGKLEL